MYTMQLELPGPGIPLILERPMSHQEFEAFCLANPELQIEREPDGKLTITSPVSFISGERENEIAAELLFYAREHGGRALSSSTGFRLPDGAVRSPDASYVTEDQMERFTQEDLKYFLAVVPVFIAEILSPTDRLDAAKEKMQTAWIGNGVKLAWLVDADHDRLWVYRADGSVELVSPLDRVIGGEDVMPGFEFNLKWFKK
ncbi:MAG: Uma2 family endonuclease [Bacteroidota bacterium]